jgi:hypothetical protein
MILGLSLLVELAVRLGRFLFSSFLELPCAKTLKRSPLSIVLGSRYWCAAYMCQTYHLSKVYPKYEYLCRSRYS